MPIQRLVLHSRAVLLLVMAACLAACASAPVQEMSDARQAMDAAVQSGAADRAPAQISQAHAALSQAEKMLKNRQYSWARYYAKEARNKAITALSIAKRDTPHTVSPESTDN